MPEFSPSRRAFIAGGLGTAAALAVPSLLSACSTGSSAGLNAAPSGGGVAFPTFVKFNGPAPDVPGAAYGVPDGYFKYPTHLVTSVSKPPGSGGTVTAALLTYGVPPALSANAYWQEFNKRLNVNFEPDLIGDADWLPKISTVIAGGNLPDFIQLWGNIPDQLAFVKAKCQDLSEYLSGDAVKKYPNLANIPPYAWKMTRMGGRLYGLPQDRGPFTANLFIQQNLAEDAGIPHPKNITEFTALMKALNRPDKGQWAMGAQAGTSYNSAFFYQLFGVPNQWSVNKSGKFTKDIETEEAKAAVAYARSLFAAGYFHPDSNVMTDEFFTDYIGGKIATGYDGFSSYDYYWQNTQAVDPHFQVRVVLPFGHDGSKGIYYTGPGSFSVTAMKQAKPDRIEELLRVADYLAAPFGTEENFFLVNGVKGVDYTLDAKANPVQTKQGSAELGNGGVSQGYITSAPKIFIDTQYPDFVTTVSQQARALVAVGVADPTVGLYSPTYSTKQATLNQLLSDQVSAMIAGRAPMSTFDAMISDWRSAGGNQSRKEYEQAYDQENKA